MKKNACFVLIVVFTQYLFQSDIAVNLVMTRIKKLMKMRGWLILINILLNLLAIFLLYMIISVFWQFIELKFYNEVTPRAIDDVIAVILAVSLFFNLTK
ncbi:hypothetical protein AB1L07_02615 [Niallia alba]|uniref:hypothetical protein n=1 Tax=Niallia alba TaxID=2729105 RepID=UPI00399F8B5E